MERGPDRPHPLWAVPLIAGVLPAVAVLVALLLSVRLGLIPACNPLIEGCVSLYTPDEQTRDRVGNVLEWHGALVFTLFFLSLAWLWHKTGFSVRLTTWPPLP